MTQAELEAQLATRRAQREEAFAGRLTGGGARGNSYSRAVVQLAEIDRDIREITQQLRALAPDTYGAPASGILGADFRR